ncbi:MAG: hypothetical protein ABI165_10365 [Bryobacteraceae bacterium]
MRKAQPARRVRENVENLPGDPRFDGPPQQGVEICSPGRFSFHLIPD